MGKRRAWGEDSIDTVLWKENGKYYKACYYPRTSVLSVSLLINYKTINEMLEHLYTKRNVSSIEWNAFMRRVLKSGGKKTKLR